MPVGHQALHRTQVGRGEIHHSVIVEPATQHATPERRGQHPPERRTRGPRSRLPRARPPGRRAGRRPRAPGRPYGPGPRRRPGPSSASRTGSTLVRTRTRAKDGSPLCGSDHGRMPRLVADRCRGGPAQIEEGPQQSASPHAMPGDRPQPRTARQSEQHGFGLVVERVTQQHGRAALGPPSAPRRRSAPGGRRPPGRRSCGDTCTATTSTSVRPRPVSIVRRARPPTGPNRPATRDRRPPRSRAVTRRRPTSTAATARAVESVPPEQATSRARSSVSQAPLDGLDGGQRGRTQRATSHLTSARSSDGYRSRARNRHPRARVRARTPESRAGTSVVSATYDIGMDPRQPQRRLGDLGPGRQRLR